MSQIEYQPPSGGCVLKREMSHPNGQNPSQPPSGGCVLKHSLIGARIRYQDPAAFGRLRVETNQNQQRWLRRQTPAAFGRLRVETSNYR